MPHALWTPTLHRRRRRFLPLVPRSLPWAEAHLVSSLSPGCRLLLWPLLSSNKLHATQKEPFQCDSAVCQLKPRGLLLPAARRPCSFPAPTPDPGRGLTQLPGASPALFPRAPACGSILPGQVPVLGTHPLCRALTPSASRSFLGAAHTLLTSPPLPLRHLRGATGRGSPPCVVIHHVHPVPGESHLSYDVSNVH